MDEAAARQQAISSNIANVNTPGYQRLDVSTNFQNAYANALSRLSEGDTISNDDMPEPTIEKAISQGPAKPDGNTVQIQQEMVGLAQNSARYEFSGQLLTVNYHNLKSAITGEF